MTEICLVDYLRHVCRENNAVQKSQKSSSLWKFVVVINKSHSQIKNNPRNNHEFIIKGYVIQNWSFTVFYWPPCWWGLWLHFLIHLTTLESYKGKEPTQYQYSWHWVWVAAHLNRRTTPHVSVQVSTRWSCPVWLETTASVSLICRSLVASSHAHVSAHSSKAVVRDKTDENVTQLLLEPAILERTLQ